MKRNPLALLLIPFATYLASYLYLAVYHKKLWLWDTVVHESGTLTLLQTIFYSSHFLGHIPSLTIIAVLFASWYKVFFGSVGIARFSIRRLSLAVAFVALCFLLSLLQFGKDETFRYLFLSQQSVTRAEPGGSYLLHLPSTLSLVILIPLFIAFISLIFRRKLSWHKNQLGAIVSTVAVAFGFAFLVTFDSPASIPHALSDPRYLAHSVRELATFPLIFFPVPLVIWFLNEPSSASTQTSSIRLPLLILVITALPLLTYQTWIPMSVGIGELAQKPAFATSPLSTGYLLASHYFEHVLDTIFFTLVCLALIPGRGMKVIDSSFFN